MIKVQQIASIEIDGDDLHTLANVCEIIRRVIVDSSQVKSADIKNDPNYKLSPILLCPDDYQIIRAFIDKCGIESWSWRERG